MSLRHFGNTFVAKCIDNNNVNQPFRPRLFEGDEIVTLSLRAAQNAMFHILTNDIALSAAKSYLKILKILIFKRLNLFGF